MRDRIEQDRTQAVTFPGRLTPRESFDGVGPFYGDGDQTSYGFQALSREIATGEGQRSNRADAHSQRHETDPMLAIEHRFAPVTD